MGIVRRGWILLLTTGSLNFLLWHVAMRAQVPSRLHSDDRLLAAGKTDSIEVDLHVGQFLQFSVEQTTGRVSAALHAPDGTESGYGSAMSLPRFQVAAIANATGTYRLEIHAGPGNPIDAHYRLSVNPPRIANPEDEEAARISSSIGVANRLTDEALATGAKPATLHAAIDSYRSALELIRNSRNPEAEGRALQGLASAYLLGNASSRAVADLDSAVETLDQAIPIWRRLGDWGAESEALFLKAGANSGRGHDYEAMDAGEYLAAEAKKHGDTQKITAAWSLVSAAANRAGLIDRSITAEQQLLNLQKDPKSAAAADHMIRIAVLYLRLLDTRASLAYRQSAAGIYESLGRKKDFSLALYWLTLGHVVLGDNKTAERYYDRMVQVDPTMSNATLLLQMGRTNAALKELLQKLDRSQQERKFGVLWTRDEPDAWSALAAVYMQLQDPENASNALEQALQSWPVKNLPGARIEFLAGVAGRYMELGQYSRALELYREYERLVVEKGASGFPQYPVFIGAMANTELKLNRLDSARVHLETAIALREEARSRIASLELGAGFFSQSQFIFGTYAEVLLHQHAVEPQRHLDELAFETVERARSHALIASLADSIARIQDHVDPQFRNKEHQLREQLNATALELQTGGNPQRTEALTLRSNQLAGELSSLQGDIRRASPSFASITEPAPLRIQEIRDMVLDSDTTLVEYSLGKVAASYVFVLSRDSLRVFPLPPRAVIDAASQRVIRSLTDKKRTDMEFASAAAELSRLILAPLGPLRTGQRLLIVSDGALNLVPFSALPDPGKAGAYLFSNHEIVRLPSASALATMRQLVATRKERPRQGIAILADPLFGKNDVRAATTANPESLQRTLTATDVVLSRLPFSQGEAQAIRKVAPAGSRLLTGAEANRALVMRGDLSNYRIIHFATHGLVNTDEPSLSGLVLSLVDDKGRSQDGFLRLHDIYNLRLNAELVVLSACQTAVGPNVNGEGVMSLSRGFFYAGTPRVISSLWKVDDRATAELMGAFYRNLFVNKVPPAASLRAAQLEMQSGKQFASPYYWAAFELQGEWK